MEKPKLTQYSHGSGCGCKIAPADLERILSHVDAQAHYPALLVGLNTRDDAAVFELSDGQCIISTTDFFMPIVDDAFDFGRIAAANALSDVYAMGGKPLMAVAILGWPVEQLGAEMAAEVVNGARTMCALSGIPLAGGHSIDSKEPFFGLAVTGTVKKHHIKRNSAAAVGDVLYLTKPLGVGIVSTAMKRGLAQQNDIALVVAQMCTLNRAGEALGPMPEVHAMTDVTGFGLLGHLIEICEGSACGAAIEFGAVPTLGDSVLKPYMDQFIMPDNTMRNFKAFAPKCTAMSAVQLQLMCDPQTNGGLLVAVDRQGADAFEREMARLNCPAHRIGHTVERTANTPLITLF